MQQSMAAAHVDALFEVGDRETSAARSHRGGQTNYAAFSMESVLCL